jgi:hypothetical protein
MAQNVTMLKQLYFADVANSTKSHSATSPKVDFYYLLTSKMQNHDEVSLFGDGGG